MKWGLRSSAKREVGRESVQAEQREGIKSSSQEWRGRPPGENQRNRKTARQRELEVGPSA